jgi:hypothetical protein
MKKFVVIAAAAVILSGCAAPMHQYHPLVDTDTTSTKYQRDLEDCRAYAMTKPSAESAAAVGAVIGALAGIALLALSGGRDGWGNEAAGVGALLGGAEGYSKGAQGQQGVVKRCLAGRGYRVLD